MLVTWQQNNIQGARTYRSGTGYGCPHRYTVPINNLSPIPPVRCWSCDSKVHTQGARAYRSGTSYGCPHWYTVPIIICPQSPTGPVLVMWQQNIQGAGTYRSGTGYGCPHRYTVPIIICHQSPLVRYWSCNNINKHTLGTRTYLSGSGFRFPIILSPIHTCLVLVMFDKTGYPGCQFLPARYRLHLPSEFFFFFFCYYYFVTRSHRSGAVHVTRYRHTRGTSPYWYGTG